MNNLNTISIDLAKNVFQVGVFSPQHKMQSNKQFSRQKLAPFMAKQDKAIVVMEACYSSHHWARLFDGTYRAFNSCSTR